MPFKMIQYVLTSLLFRTTGRHAARPPASYRTFRVKSLTILSLAVIFNLRLKIALYVTVFHTRHSTLNFG